MLTGFRILVLVLAGYALAPQLVTSRVSAQSPTSATADVRDRLSRFIGTVTFNEEQGGVRITGTLRHLAAGAHGLHIDNMAKCLSPSYVSAGTIFNPTGKKHGLRNPAGPEVGDLPSLVVQADGTATVNIVANGATLSGGPSSLIGGNGTALVIHAQDDDQVTDPEGNAGERIACGVVLPGDPAAASATAQSRGPTPAAGVFGPGAVVPVPGVAQPAAAGAAPPGAQSGGNGLMPLIASPGFVLVVGILLLGVGYLLRRQPRQQ